METRNMLRVGRMVLAEDFARCYADDGMGIGWLERRETGVILEMLSDRYVRVLLSKSGAVVVLDDHSLEVLA